MMSRHLAGLMFALGFGMLVGCFIRADDHCANNGGNSNCVKMKIGFFCDACTPDNDGCVDKVDEIDNRDDCYYAGDGTDDDSGTGSDDGDNGSDDGSDDGGSGSGSGGTSSDGGGTSSDGGTDSTSTGDDGTTGTTDDGGTTVECDAADGQPDADDCTDAAAPFCVSGECKDCSEAPTPDSSCAALGGSADYCDTNAGECVACLSHDHCDTIANARCNDANHTCVPCQSSTECAGITDHEVCDDGTCVECTPSQDSACSGKLCHAIDLECTNFDPGDAGLCETCIADAHCSTDQLCIPMTFDAQDVGHFCLWRQDAPSGPNGNCFTARPYADTTSETSIEGVTTTVCGLRATTCPALKDYSLTDCEAGGDEGCGAVGLDDGLCRDSGGSNYYCTVPCLSNFDCPGSQACNTGTTPYYCEL